MSTNAEIGASGEQVVQLNATSGGQNVRTLDIATVQPDGSLVTVQMQVVTISDKTGKVLDFRGIEEKLENIHETLKQMLGQLILNGD